ncbi:MAG: tail fiber domain-containing protein [Thermoanaerobaculia bacterium]
MEIYDFYDYAAMRLNNYIATFAFAVNPYGEFTINKIGSGGQEISVDTRLDADGPTMKVQGSVQATQFIANSSRAVKTDFESIDGKEVLARLAEVPVMAWRFKTEEENARHVGPVAEDFQAAFQLGDGKTISTMDAGGVTMAAVQGLYALLQERERDLHELRAEKDREIAELRQGLAELENVRSEVAALRRAMTK